MSTVRQKRKNGSVYVYESHNVWDKDRKRVRAVRKYLGREDPVTGELIPSSGKPGRPKSATPAAPSADAVVEVPAVTDDEARIRELEAELAEARARIEALETKNASLCASMSEAVSILVSAQSARG